MSAVAAVALVVGTIGPPLVGRGVFLASDLVTHAYPWRAVSDPGAEAVAEHGPVSDTVDAVYPGRKTYFDGLRDGDPLNWTPYVVGGRPHGSHSYNGVLGPFALASYLLVPSWYAPALIKLLTMAAAIGFTYLFCRRLSFARAASSFAGIAFAGSGFMVMWTNWSQPEVAALIPALFWATERFLQRPRPGTAVPVALAVAAMLLGNFPAVVFYALYVLGPYVVVRTALERGPLARRVGRLLGAGAAVVAGVALVAAVVLPFAITLGDTDTGDRSSNPDNHLTLTSLITTVAPTAFGLSTESPERPYFGPKNQVEAIAFVGVPTALLALVGAALARRRATPRGAIATFVAATALLGWATFGGGAVLELLQNLPAFDNSFIGRTRSITGFTVAVLAGAGLDAVMRRGTPPGRIGWARIGTVTAAAVVVGAVGFQRALSHARDFGRADVLREALWLPVGLGLATIALLLAVRLAGHRSRVGTAALSAVPVLLVVQSLGFAVPLLPNEEQRLLYPVTPAIAHLQTVADGERIAPEGGAFLGSANAVYGIRSATGHAFYAEEWKDALLAVDPDAFSLSPTLPFLGGEVEVATAAMLDRMGVTWWAAAPSTPPPGERIGEAVAGSSCAEPVVLENAHPLDVPVDIDPATGVRGLVLRVCEPVALGEEATLTAQLGAGGARGRNHPTGTTPAGELVVAVPGEELTAAPSSITLTLGGAPGRSMALARVHDEIAVDLVQPVDDGLRLDYADDLRIYERTRSLGRFHWAGAAEVVRDADTRLGRLVAGDVPDGMVVLSEQGPTGGGGDAGISVVQDDAESIRVLVDAATDGYLVVADSIHDDWVATVDGAAVPLVEADHAAAAVHVPSGEHRVLLRYRPRGQGIGLGIAALTVALLVAATTWDSIRRRRRDALATPRPQ